MNTLLGLPLRKNKLNDPEFTERIREKILKKKRIRIVFPILSISMIIVLLLYIVTFISSSNNQPELNELRWIGFCSGFSFGGICFAVLIQAIIAIINWCEGLEINRVENLLIKYYDELKNGNRWIEGEGE